jgi:DNA modification methylase
LRRDFLLSGVPHRHRKGRGFLIERKNMNDKKVNVLNEAHGRNWSIYNADCVDFASQLPDECVDFTVYSPPFANLYVYSDSVADMGNCENDEAFFEQYLFMIKEKLRITKPGRLSCVHCMDLPMSMAMHGYIGRRDFSGEIIRAHVDAGWIFHCRVTVWKDPVVEMQRTKALGLLHKQIKKDSCRSRMGNPDYLLVFYKPGQNLNPVTHTAEDFPVDQWQQWASPVWMDINQTNVLNKASARDEKDEKHICPLQLDFIRRCLVMWSNKGDTVFSPFTGIGSEGYESIRLGRKFIGTELKASYFDQASKNLAMAESETGSLFDA